MATFEAKLTEISRNLLFNESDLPRVLFGCLNASLNFGQVMELALGNRRKHGEEDLEGNIPRGLFMRGRFDALDLRDLTTIDGRFWEANRILHEKYRVKIATMTFKRLLQELICSAGLNRGSIRRKSLVRRLATMP
jgi:hypothetical protein